MRPNEAKRRKKEPAHWSQRIGAKPVGRHRESCLLGAGALRSREVRGSWRAARNPYASGSFEGDGVGVGLALDFETF